MPRGRSRTPRGPGVLRGAGPGCLRGRSCAPRARFCGGELVLGASGDRVALGGGNPASPGPVLLGGGGAVLGASGDRVALWGAGPAPPGASPSAEPGLAGCRMLWVSWWSCPGAAWGGRVGNSRTLGFGFRKWVLALPGCPRGSHPACLAGAGHCLVPAPGALCAPRVALQSITSGQASPQRSGSVLAGPLGQAGPSRGGRAPTAAPSQLGEQDPLPLMGGPGHKCTFTSHP